VPVFLFGSAFGRHESATERGQSVRRKRKGLALLAFRRVTVRVRRKTTIRITKRVVRRRISRR